MAEVLSSALIALLLLLAAAWLMRSHVRTWMEVQQRAKEPDAKELDYRRRQYRRRMQTSAMLGLLGIGIVAAQVSSALSAPPWLWLLLWCVVVVLAVWLALLAVADMVSTRFYFGRLKHDYLIEEARLHAELRRLQRIRGNGHDTKEAEKRTERGIGGQDPSAKDQNPAEDQ